MVVLRSSVSFVNCWADAKMSLAINMVAPVKQILIFSHYAGLAYPLVETESDLWKCLAGEKPLFITTR